ncbi:hypothetical protein ACGGAQ_30300 [Micromonospora sp. NPDC047557]|uniref:hypothetical protein n=1 Tax=Micromonospora sp. NPDC047557 TaxID=3364250 RepID=UPI0037178620
MPSSGVALAAIIRAQSGPLARQWAAGMRLGDDDGLVRAEFIDRYLPSILRILVRLVESPSPELVAVYRDELQRYPLQLGHPFDPTADNVFGFEIGDLLAAQHAAFADRFGPGPVLDALDRLHEPLLAPAGRRVDMLLLGDCVMNGIRCFLAEDLRRSGIDLRGYHQYFSSALSAHFDAATAREFLARHPVAMIGFSPFTFDGLPVYRQMLMEASERRRLPADLDRVLDVVDRALADIRSWSDAPILLQNASGAPDGPDRAEMTSLPPLTPARLETIGSLNRALRERVRAASGVVLVDEAGIAGRLGLREATRPAVDVAGSGDSLFHTSRLGREVARTYAEIVVAWESIAHLRALAVDFDGTLWSGVVAEGAVEHHRDRQALLRRLARQGVVLIGLSRGAPESVRWDGAEISSEDFVLVKRSWQPKPLALAEALTTLGIRPAQTGVIDDDASERAMLASAFPELTLLDAAEPAVWRSLGIAADLRVVTGDGARRTERYRVAIRREEFFTARTGQQTMTTAMAALGLTVCLGPMRPADVPRTRELLRRTNQFNTTGVVFGRQALDRMTEPSAEHVVHIARLRDRFGDFGLVSAAVVHRERRSIESFVLSCRAMGYGVEQVLLNQMIATYGTPMEARLVRTRLNEPCHGLFAGAGFREYTPGLWRLEHQRRPRVPEYLSVETLNPDQ